MAAKPKKNKTSPPIKKQEQKQMQKQSWNKKETDGSKKQTTLQKPSTKQRKEVQQTENENSDVNTKAYDAKKQIKSIGLGLIVIGILLLFWQMLPIFIFSLAPTILLPYIKQVILGLSGYEQFILILMSILYFLLTIFILVVGIKLTIHASYKKEVYFLTLYFMGITTLNIVFNLGAGKYLVAQLLLLLITSYFSFVHSNTWSRMVKGQ